MPLVVEEIDLEEAKKKKKERTPIDEALEILEKYEEGTPPRKFGYED